jgi:hypothetical protein
VFLAVGTERALRAALLAAEGKPIVLLAIDFDPVTSGYVASLSRPGGRALFSFLCNGRSRLNQEVFRALPRLYCSSKPTRLCATSCPCFA